MCYRTQIATACTIESGHLALLSGAGEGEVVNRRLARRRGAREEEWTGLGRRGIAHRPPDDN